MRQPGAHPIWHHWLRPNSESRQPSRDTLRYPSPLIWTVNQQGCRYRRDLSREPARETRRIIVMGDSFTEGYYQDSTFAAVLDQLAKYHPPRGVLWNRAFEGEVKKLAERNQVPFYSAYDSIQPHFTPTGQLLWSRLFAEHYVLRKKVART